MLKPCQHCGNTATVEFKQRYDNHRYPREFWYARIECSMCDVMTDWRCVSEINASFYDIDSDAVDALCAAWNTRADEERIRRDAFLDGVERVATLVPGRHYKEHKGRLLGDVPMEAVLDCLRALADPKEAEDGN